MTDEELSAPATVRQLMMLANDMNRLKVDLPGLIRQAIIDDERAASSIVAVSAAEAEQARQQVLADLPSLVANAVSLALAAALQQPANRPSDGGSP